MRITDVGMKRVWQGTRSVRGGMRSSRCRIRVVKGGNEEYKRSVESCYKMRRIGGTGDGMRSAKEAMVSPEAEFLDEIYRVFLIAINSHIYRFALGFLFLQSHATSYIFLQSVTVQGGSDISGTTSKLHRYIKKIFLLIILLKSISAVCRRVNKKTDTFRQI